MAKELVEYTADLSLPKCRFTKNMMGLEFDKKITFEELANIGKKIKIMEGAVQFWIGDWINAKWGKYEHKKYDEATKLGYEKETVRRYGWISDKVESVRRRTELSHNHHELVAKFTPEQQKEWLAKAVEHDWSTRELSSAIREQNRPETPEIPEGKFDVIYADPPWQYEKSTIDSSREIEKQYPTLSLEEIKNLIDKNGVSILNTFTENAILFLWATAPKLEEAIEVLNAWGFIYRTNAVWDKEHIGMGYFFRGQHELLLVGVRGTFPHPEESTRVSSVYREVRGKHSVKPEYYRELIEKYYPQCNYIDLFGRKTRPGWTIWGTEVDLKRT